MSGKAGAGCAHVPVVWRAPRETDPHVALLPLPAATVKEAQRDAAALLCELPPMGPATMLEGDSGEELARPSWRGGALPAPLPAARQSRPLLPAPLAGIIGRVVAPTAGSGCFQLDLKGRWLVCCGRSSPKLSRHGPASLHKRCWPVVRPCPHRPCPAGILYECEAVPLAGTAALARLKPSGDELVGAQPARARKAAPRAMALHRGGQLAPCCRPILPFPCPCPSTCS